VQMPTEDIRIDVIKMNADKFFFFKSFTVRILLLSD